MKEIVNYLKENSVQYLATVGRDGKAKCRPFMFCLEKNRKLWFCTNNQKDVYKDMMENPWIEITTSGKDFSWIRISGKAVFKNNMEIKKECLNYPLIKNIYQTPDNPIFEVFYIEEGEAVIADFSGNPPRKFSF